MRQRLEVLLATGRDAGCMMIYHSGSNGLKVLEPLLMNSIAFYIIAPAEVSAACVRATCVQEGREQI